MDDDNENRYERIPATCPRCFLSFILVHDTYQLTGLLSKEHFCLACRVTMHIKTYETFLFLARFKARKLAASPGITHVFVGVDYTFGTSSFMHAIYYWRENEEDQKKKDQAARFRSTAPERVLPQRPPWQEPWPFGY